jgi:hypothetical protein
MCLTESLTMPGLHVAPQVIYPFGQRGVGGGDLWVAAGDPFTLRIEPRLECVGQNLGRAAVLGQAEDTRAAVKALGNLRMIVAPLPLVLFTARPRSARFPYGARRLQVRVRPGMAAPGVRPSSAFRVPISQRDACASAANSSSFIRSAVSVS